MEKPESFCRCALHLADQWPAIQRLIECVDGNYRYNRGGRGRVTDNAWDHCGGEGKSQHHQSGRAPSASFERWETDNTCVVQCEPDARVRQDRQEV